MRNILPHERKYFKLQTQFSSVSTTNIILVASKIIFMMSALKITPHTPNPQRMQSSLPHLVWKKKSTPVRSLSLVKNILNCIRGGFGSPESAGHHPVSFPVDLNWGNYSMMFSVWSCKRQLICIPGFCLAEWLMSQVQAGTSAFFCPWFKPRLNSLY